MLPQSQPRKKKNSSKVNLTISFVVHTVLVVALFYFAAREGLLGKKIQHKITAEIVKEKPPEKPKEPEKPKIEPPKVEQPKIEQPKVAEESKPVAPPPAVPVAVPPAEVPSFVFEGGRTVNAESDPVQLYKGYMEYELRAKWNRPENMDDASYTAEVAVSVDKSGNLNNVAWQKGSGNDKWDQSVKDVFKLVQNIGHRPPTNFPPQVTIRFDVQEETEPLMMP